MDIFTLFKEIKYCYRQLFYTKVVEVCPVITEIYHNYM